MRAETHSSLLTRRFQLRGRLPLIAAAGALFALVYSRYFEPLSPSVSTNAAFAEEAAADRAPAYTVTAYRQSYFALDENGGLVEQNGLPIRAEKVYQFQRKIDPDMTAIVVMDPWVDMATDHLNQYYSRIAESRVVPLVNKGLERGHRIIILTNDPAVVEYNTKIHPKLATLVADGKAALLYHQDLDDDQFAAYLRKAGIKTLIYTGFASNMCVIGRRMGMIPMVQHGFKNYFVPEASAAVETAGTWETGSVHRETTDVISQWIAEIVHYDDFMQTAASLPPAALTGEVDDAIQGTWLPSTAELAGQEFPDEVRKTIKLTVRDGKYTVTVGKQIDQGTTKLNSSADPKQIDITGVDGPNKGKTILAIYELDGDTLRICYDLSGKNRPAEFKSKPDTQLFLVTYKREKR